MYLLVSKYHTNDELYTIYASKCVPLCELFNFSFGTTWPVYGLLFCKRVCCCTTFVQYTLNPRTESKILSGGWLYKKFDTWASKMKWSYKSLSITWKKKTHKYRRHVYLLRSIDKHTQYNTWLIKISSLVVSHFIFLWLHMLFISIYLLLLSSHFNKSNYR